MNRRSPECFGSPGCFEAVAAPAWLVGGLPRRAPGAKTGPAQENLRSKEVRKLKIVILGPDGAGKSSVIQGLMRRLDQPGRLARMRYLKPLLVKPRRGPAVINASPHGRPPRSVLASLAKILVWLMEEWYAHLFWDKKQALLVCDRYYHDLLIDPLRYRYGGPPWMARLVGRLMPQPQLWILLDAPAELLQARKQEVSREESARQRQAYLAFVRHERAHAIIDAAQPLDKVIDDVERAVAAIDGASRPWERP